MERRLEIVRASTIPTFFLALVLSCWSLIGERKSFILFALLAHLSLCVFIATESFGPIAARRSTISRGLARTFFVPSIIVVAVTVYYLAWAAT